MHWCLLSSFSLAILSTITASPTNIVVRAPVDQQSNLPLSQDHSVVNANFTAQVRPWSPCSGAAPPAQYNVQFEGPVKFSINDIILDRPDVTAEHPFIAKMITLEGYRVRNKFETTNPTWVSVGHLRIVKNNFGEIFHFRPESVSVNIKTLDNVHKEALIKAAKIEYPCLANIIKAENIVPLPLQQVSCRIEFVDTNHAPYVIHGDVHDFNTAPLQLEFPLRKGTEKRIAFERRVAIQHNATIDIKCELKAGGYKERVNLLVVTADQMRNMHVANRLLGQEDDSFVIQPQLVNLADQMASIINLEENYEVERDDFAEEFVQKLVAKSNFKFRQVAT